MNQDRLPPLTSLRAFEAAARHMSFARAADELSVTPAALSFQIKSLEEHLGAPVFHRLNRAVELTEAGRAMVPGVRDGFTALNMAWRAARRGLNSNSLTVTAGPAFTAKWLAPRLFRFAQDHPEIELRFSASLRLVDFQRDDIDVAIRYGMPQDGENLYSVQLLGDHIMPVMVPSLVAEYPTVQHLTGAPLLYDDSLAFLRLGADWATWFAMAGVADAPPKGVRFSQADHAVDAALSGGGVLLARTSLTGPDVQAGRLVAPYDLALKLPTTYRFVCAKGNENRPAIAAFREWVMAEMKREPDLTLAKTVVPVGAQSAGSD